MLEKEIAAFKAAVMAKRNDPLIDHKRPYKKSKRLEINVIEREDATADVMLLYSMRYSRMFGQVDMVHRFVLEHAAMQDACKAAKELKKLLPAFSIVYQPYNAEDHEMF